MFNINLVEKLKIILNFGKNKKSEIGRGGDGGDVLIVTQIIRGAGSITAEGGEGIIGGKGGKVTVISGNDQLKGEISVKGGKSLK